MLVREVCLEQKLKTIDLTKKVYTLLKKIYKKVNSIEKELKISNLLKKDFYTVKEACLLYDVKKSTVYDYCNRGLLEYRKRGKYNRFSKTDLDNFFYHEADLIKSQPNIQQEIDEEDELFDYEEEHDVNYSPPVYLNTK